MTRLGIICALKQEAKVFISGQLTAQTLLPVDEKIIVILSGMGLDNAEQMAYKLVAQNIQCLISFGTAGGLSEALKAGDICIPETVKDDRQYAARIDNAYRQRLITSLIHAQHPVHTGPLLSMGNMMVSCREKQQTYARYQCDLVDMESAAIVRIAAIHHLPALVIRCIIDTADTCIPASVLQRTGSFGDVNLPRLAADLIHHPADIIKLIQLASAFKKTRRCLQLLGRHTVALAA